MDTVARMLRREALNEWNLFGLIMIPLSLVIVMTATVATDLSSPSGVSSLLQLSVRCSVPWLYLAFAASSLHMLLGNEFSRWLLRNRRIFGLCFAGGMAWQLTFILWMLIGHWGYYMDEAYALADLSTQIPGYIVLIAMASTSFKPVRRKLRPAHWRRLHKIGIYYLWGVVWSTYWYELYYYDDIQIIDYLYYWAGFLAWGTRIGAWSRNGWRSAKA
jgi:sulfoxide reductase heme-binding subunit YedZ